MKIRVNKTETAVFKRKYIKLCYVINQWNKLTTLGQMFKKRSIISRGGKGFGKINGGLILIYFVKSNVHEYLFEIT